MVDSYQIEYVEYKMASATANESGSAADAANIAISYRRPSGVASTRAGRWNRGAAKEAGFK